MVLSREGVIRDISRVIASVAHSALGSSNLAKITKRLVRSTIVATADLMLAPIIKSLSQRPGTRRFSTSVRPLTLQSGRDLLRRPAPLEHFANDLEKLAIWQQAWRSFGLCAPITGQSVCLDNIVVLRRTIAPEPSAKRTRGPPQITPD